MNDKYHMQFSQFLQENNLQNLYFSTVSAFPKTTKRQYSTHTIKITELTWLPFVGVNTLFIKGLAQNTENGKEYNPIIVFKNISYHPAKTENSVGLIASDEKEYFFDKINNNDVLVRCQCNDFFWRFNHRDHIDQSLYGRVRRKYEGQGLWEANPLKLPGMCKHILALVKVLNRAGIMEE